MFGRRKAVVDGGPTVKGVEYDVTTTWSKYGERMEVN